MIDFTKGGFELDTWSTVAKSAIDESQVADVASAKVFQNTFSLMVTLTFTNGKKPTTYALTKELREVAKAGDTLKINTLQMLERECTDGRKSIQINGEIEKKK